MRENDFEQLASEKLWTKVVFLFSFFFFFFITPHQILPLCDYFKEGMERKSKDR